MTYTLRHYVPLSDGLVVLANHANVQELRHLELQGRWDCRDDVTRLSLFSQLRSISLILGSASWTTRILDELSQLSQLTDLHIDLKDAHYDYDWSTAPPQINSQEVSFLALRKLTVAGPPGRTLIVLDHIAANHLEHIHICFAHFFTCDDCGRLYQSISRFRSLRKISHTLDQYSTPRTSQAFLRRTTDLLAVVEPIFVLPDLEYLSLRLGFKPLGKLYALFHVSDDCVSRVASAYPSLKELTLETIPRWNKADNWSPRWHPYYVAGPTFASLRCLAEACPQLIDLGLSLEFEAESLPSEACISSSHRLQRLDLLDTPIKDDLVATLGRLLTNLFPHLDSINSDHGMCFNEIDKHLTNVKANDDCE